MEDRYRIVDSIFIEGNNGGDFVEIKKIEDGLIHLRIGHCCVMIIDKIVPVEFLTASLSEMILEHDNINSIIDSFCWDKKYKDKLKDKVKEIY